MSQKNHAPLFSLRRAVLIIAANCIGTGIFTTTGYALRDLQSPWVVLSVWVLGGIYSLLGVISYASLHHQFPGSGGEYHFLSEAYHRWVGILGGVTTIFAGFTLPLAAASMGFASYLKRAYPLEIPDLVLAAGVLTLVFLSQLFSLQKGLKWHDRFVYVKLILFLIMIVLAFVLADWQLPSGNFEFSIKTYCSSFFWIAYAFSGWNAVYYIASEFTSDEKAVNRASYWGDALVCVLYVAMNIPLLFGCDTKKLYGVTGVVAEYFQLSTGMSVENWVALAIALGLLSTISVFLLLVPRIYSRMAHDGVLPKMFQFQPGEHPRAVLVFQYLLTLFILVLIPFEFILKYAGFTLTCCALLSVTGLLFSRWKKLTALQLLGAGAYVTLTTFLVVWGGPWF